MKMILKFDGNTERKSLRGFFVADDKGNALSKPVLMPVWMRADGFPDGLPDGFEVELKPIYTNGSKKPTAKAAAKPKSDKAAAKKKVEKPAAEKPTE